MVEASNYTTLTSLKLEEDSNDHSRFLTIHANHIVALGGENGNITAVALDSSHDANHDSPTSNKNEARVVKKYDDVVKALAFSEDGKRVAVGYDDGNVDVYEYSDDDLSGGHGKDKATFHPFICAKPKSSTGENENDKDNDGDDDLFFTQSSQPENDTSSLVNQQPSFRLQHRFEASIRHLQFRPMLNRQGTGHQKYYLAIASEASPGFMIVDVTSETSSSSSKYLDDEAKSAHREGGVRSLCFSPDGQVVSTLGMDGRMVYWATKGGDPGLEWEMMHSDSHKVVNKADMGEFSDVCDRSLYPVWSRCGSVFGIPGSEELKFRKRDVQNNENDDTAWCQKNRMVLNMALSSRSSDSDTDGACIVGMAFDPRNEGFVVTSTRDGSICLWKINEERKENDPEGQFVKKIQGNESMCTHILWHQDPNSKEESLFFALQNGNMIKIIGRNNFIPKDVSKSSKIVTNGQQKEEGIETNKEYQDSQVSLSDDLDEGGLETQPLEEKDQKVPNDEYEMDTYDNDEDDDDYDRPDDDPMTDKNKFVADEAEENEQKDDDSQFDDVILPSTQDEQLSRSNPSFSLQRQNDEFPTKIDDLNDLEHGDFGHDKNLQLDDVASVESVVHQQEAFAPSSTPHGSRTIFCWNHIGVITSRDDPERSIDIDFTDVMFNRPINFRDNMNFVMGSLGDEGAIFATDLLEDVDDYIDDNVRDALDGLNGMSEATKNVVKRSERRSGKMRATGSCVYFHRFNTFGSLKNKDWFVTLHEGEKVISCATGSGWNAVATSRRFLRSFTSGGVQGPVIWLKGEPVTMVGRGNFLAVFYHQSNPSLDKTQKLGYSLYDGTNMREISFGSVAAISPGSSLTWVGFSNDLALSVMDSNGIVSMLMSMKPEESGETLSSSWVPMLDTFGLKKSKEDAFWPVCVQNGKLICVPLKGVPHPNPVRRPLTTSLQLRIPLARDGKDKIFGMEEVAVRANLALEHKNCLNDFMINHSGENQEDIELEYSEMSRQVDKITLRLFHSMIGSGKVESALDLAGRLHNEQSFELAMQIADKSNQLKLSDKIYSMKEKRFASVEEDHHGDESADENSFDGSVDTRTHDTNESDRATKVSPEVSNSKNKRKFQQESSEKPKCRKRMNPFVTNMKRSPGKSPISKSHLGKKPALSRMSTFSSQSRQVTRGSKEIL